MQQKYWNYMVQVKAWIFYLDIYAEHSYKWNNRINMYGAIASSSSIAAWAIWREWSYLWAFVIAIAQVLTAIKEFLPFSKRLKLLQPFIDDMKLLYLKMEFDWYKVAEGEVPESEINKLLFEYKKEYSDIESKYLKDEMLIENLDYKEQADQKTEYYFANTF